METIISRIFISVSISMSVITAKVHVDTKIGVDIVNITQQVKTAVASSGIKDGIACVFCAGATGVITTIEYEDGVLSDVADALERMAPQDMEYKHHLKWNDGNGHSHVRATFLGPSLSIPFNSKDLILGTWQEIVFIEMDNKPRSRDLIVQIVGE